MPLTSFEVIKNHFSKNDPKIAKVLKSINLEDWFQVSSTDDHFYNLTRNIIFQQLAGSAASKIFERFEHLVGEITPQNIISFEDQAFRDVGLSWAKAKYVKDLATRIISSEVSLNDLNLRDNESVITELIKVKGIGRWTAEMFLLFTLHRENIFSYGDLGLKNGFAKLYGIDSPSPSQIEQVIAKWAPYESYGSISLWHYLDTAHK